MDIIKHIETERVIIRPFEKHDLDRFLAFMLDEKSTQYLLFSPEQKTKKGATTLFHTIISSYTEDDPIHSYVIALKNNSYIGSCGFSKIDEENVIYECYYSLLPSFTKKGYATETMNALIKYCFKHYPMTEIRAYMHPDNKDSHGVAQRIGMHSIGSQKHPQFNVEGNVFIIRKEDAASLEM